MSGGFNEDGDPDLTAAEYVLGTLDAAERAAFADRMTTNPIARAAVAAWDARLAGLVGRVDAVTPSTEVWTRIEQALGARTATMHPFKVIPGGGQASDTSLIRRSRDRWRLGALVSGGIAAALAISLLGGGGWRGFAPAKDATTYVAAVNRGGDKPALIVRVDLKTGQVVVRPVAATAPAGHSLELWYIGSDKTPRSMGLVDKSTDNLRLPGTPVDDATFAVSVEPPGGSKTGGPTGPVVYSGQLVRE